MEELRSDPSSLIPLTPVMQFGSTPPNHTTGYCYYSPRQFANSNNRHSQQQQQQGNYSKPLNSINNIMMANKESSCSVVVTNPSPLKGKANQPSLNYQTTGVAKRSAPIAVVAAPPSTNEIAEAAQRMQAKRQTSRAELAEAHNLPANYEPQPGSASSLVKTMRSKFEDPSTRSTSNIQIHLAPKTIIKKFEMLSRGAAAGGDHGHTASSSSANTSLTAAPQQHQTSHTSNT